VAEYERVIGDVPDALKEAALANPSLLAPDAPVTYVDFPHAVLFAEQSGKRLPTEAEFEYAATLGGTRDFPRGDDPEILQEWTFGRVRDPGLDVLPTEPPILGLYSNVAEWTQSRPMPYPTAPPLADSVKKLFMLCRVVRGGTWDIVQAKPVREKFLWGPRWRHSAPTLDRHPGLGLRCARSDRPSCSD
jgi:formylglycine-generating enzyme required for sulfatase activity